MTVHGIGTERTLGWVTLPIFIAAQDPHGKHVHLEIEQDFHVLSSFGPGLCLGRDFIDAHDLTISPVRGRGRIGRYTFQVNEKMSGPYSASPELFVAEDIVIQPNTQVWVPVDAGALAPGVDYAAFPRLSISPDETVRLAGPAGIITHAPTRHVLIGNYGTAAFNLERGAVIADAAAARVGDVFVPTGEAFPLTPAANVRSNASAVPIPAEKLDPALPMDVFEDEISPREGLMRDAKTALVDEAFRVGLDENGAPHQRIVDLLRRHSAAFALDGRPGRVDGNDMEIHLQADAVLRSEPPRR
ncbi:hypothetical protein OC835_007317, partial [Tilletia horrida]